MVGWEAGMPEPPARYPIRPKDDAEAAALVEAHAPDRPRIAYAFGYSGFPLPGGAKNRKHWPLAYFAWTAWRLWRGYGGSVVWLGSERERMRMWRMPRPPAWAPMDVPWGVTAGILRRCDLLVTVDNGVMHLADAVGTPSVAAFTSSPTCKVTPWNGTAKIVRLGLPCSPCYRCNKGYLPCDLLQWCAQGLKPGMVIEAARERLEALCPASPS
jgi:ADP-heptose:LPS heptosyltransferase